MATPADELPEGQASLNNLVSRLHDELERIRVAEGFQRNSEAFGFWAIRQISPDLPDRDIAYALEVGGPGDHGIDAAWWDKDYRENGQPRGALYLAQVKCPDFLQGDARFGPEPAKELHSGVNWLATAESDKLKSTFKKVKQDFEDRFHGGQKIILAVVIAGGANKGLRAEINLIQTRLREQFPTGNVSMELFDLHRLDCLYVDRLEMGDVPPPETVKFRIHSKLLIRDYGKHRALVSEIPATDLSGLVEVHSLNLYSKNIRVLLSHSDYNRGIVTTLNSEDDRHKTWYFNNGMTAVCSGFEFSEEDDDENYRTVIAHDFTIVNGCQTAETIHRTLKEWKAQNKAVEQLEDVGVLIRLIEIGGKGEGTASKLGRDVARFTNSQNPITGRDLHSNDPEQSRLREQLRGRGYFLEVKRGEWKRRIELNPDYARQFPRLEPVIDNEKAAQYFLAFWLSNPVVAKMHKKRIFEDQSVYDDIFGLGRKSEAMLVPWLFYSLQERWRLEAGYLKRAQKGGRRNRLSRAMVYTHGNLIVLSMLGTGIQANSGPGLAEDTNRLGHASDVLTQLLEGSRLGAINIRGTTRAINKSFSSNLETLYRYVSSRIRADPDLTVRNILVNENSWTEVKEKQLTAIAAAAKPLKGLLFA